MGFDDLKTQAQQLFENDTVFISRMAELQSLRRILKEQKDYNDTLEEQLKSAKEVQMMIQELLNRIELQIQLQLEKVSTMHKQIFNVEIDPVTANNTASSVGSSVDEHGRECSDQTGEMEELQAILSDSDDGQKPQLDVPTHLRPSEEDFSPKKVSKNRNRKSDADRVNVRVSPERMQHPRRTYQEGSSNAESEEQRENQIRSAGGKGRARNVKNSSSLGKDELMFRKTPTYWCGECNKGFSKRSNLTCHERIHSGERPFKCEVCDARFGRKCILAKHLRIHIGEKPFACDICMRTFREKSQLSDHMNMHSRRRPHKCTKCN